MPVPRTIEVKTDDAALDNSSRFVNASSRQVLNEVLQNARLAGASRIDISSDEDRTVVKDNGWGIDDPHKVLGADGNTAQPHATNQEYRNVRFWALARYGCQIRSETSISPKGDGIAWRAKVTPDHFHDRWAVHVTQLRKRHAEEHGTEISFELSISRLLAERCAKHLGVKTWWNGEPITQAPFTAADATSWRGVRIQPIQTWNKRLVSRICG